MATTYVSNERKVLEIETAGSVVEAGAGIAVIALAIIGLIREDTGFLTSIAAIVLGAALFAQGGAIAAEYSKLLSMISGGRLAHVEFGGGMAVELLGGGAAIVLGILGLVRMNPMVAIPCAVLAVGATMILGAAGFQRLITLKMQAADLSELAQRVAQATVSSAMTAQILAGGAAIVLGILALVTDTHTATLTLVGLLVLGASVTVSGTALTGRFLRMLGKHPEHERFISR